VCLIAVGSVYSKVGLANLCNKSIIYLNSVDNDGWEVRCPHENTLICIGTNQGNKKMRIDGVRGYYRLFAFDKGARITKAAVGGYSNFGDALSMFVRLQGNGYNCEIRLLGQYCWVSRNDSNCWSPS